MAEHLRIQNCVVAVSGGARGIGAAIAQAAGERGARVAIGDVDTELAAETAQRIGAVAYRLDVSSPDSWADFTAQVEEQLGPIDVLVNNAGIMPIGPFLDESQATVERQLGINLHGVISGVRTVLPGMLARRRGSIINVASQAGKMGIAGNVTYCATKWGVVGFSHALDDELRDTPVAVSCVLPGIVNTELSHGLPETRLAPKVEPAEIAAAVVAAVARPRREIWVPRSGRVAITITRLMPTRARALIARVLGKSDVFLNIDPATRSAYETRVATTPREDPEEARR